MEPGKDLGYSAYRYEVLTSADTAESVGQVGDEVAWPESELVVSPTVSYTYSVLVVQAVIISGCG